MKIRGILKSLSITSFAALSFNSSAALMVFTDQTLWEAALSGQTIVQEDFLGDAVDFGANSSGNVVNDLTINIIGHGTDSTRQGLDGNGFFEGEVDNSDIVTSDGANIEFVFNSSAFALIGLTDNSDISPEFNVHEIAIRVLGDLFLVSDLVGLTTDPETSAPDATVPFLGFISDSDVIDGFVLEHGDNVRSVGGSNEDFLIDAIAFAPAQIPEPSTAAFVLLSAMGLFARLRKRK